MKETGQIEHRLSQLSSTLDKATLSREQISYLNTLINAVRDVYRENKRVRIYECANCGCLQLKNIKCANCGEPNVFLIPEKLPF